MVASRGGSRIGQMTDRRGGTVNVRLTCHVSSGHSFLENGPRIFL